MSRVVVGVDGSPGASAALRFALDEARLRGAVLHVVHAWRVPLYAAAPEPGFVGMPAPTAELDEEVEQALAEDAERALAGALTELRRETGDDLGVEARAEAIRGAPAHVLLEAAEDADLLVLGARGLGGFKGLLLGSVSQQCVQHARCPTTVVPSPRDEG
ncbi:MAG TPA: universal stress protein [Gaiellaceae bacterium]|nr:universal stress protein [Gaiellaceae bacterium]